MLDSIRLKENLLRPLYILEDESNPNTSKVNTIWPQTVLDQVFDQNTLENKTLRTILEELNENIKNHGILQINFPVTSVNNMMGDVTIDKESLGLENVSNIPDNEKSLSDIQREEVKNILNQYNFQSKIDFTEYDNHLSNSNNPHHVTVEQIDKDNALKLFVTNLIYAHNTSTDLNIHADIRQNLSRLWKHVDDTNEEFNNKLNAAKEMFIKHYDDPLAHMLLFREKENISNKVSLVTNDNINETNYPNTLAVNNFIDQKLIEFNKILPHPENWYDEIIIINTRLDLPDANEKYIHKFYIIKFGDYNCNEVAYCKLDENNFYAWEITNTGAFSIIDNKYIHNNETGLTLDISKIAEDLLDDPSFKSLIQDSIREAFPDVISNYYTKEEIDSKHYIGSIKFLQGIDNGTFRYYINDDPSTMSPDILVRGLQRIAFLEYVTEHEIYDQSIHERHIISRALATRHFQKKSIYPEFLVSRNKNVILGNLNNDDGTIEEIPMNTLVSQLVASEDLRNVIVNILNEILIEFDSSDIIEVVKRALENTQITNAADILDNIISQLDDESIREIVIRALENTKPMDE